MVSVLLLDGAKHGLGSHVVQGKPLTKEQRLFADAAIQRVEHDIHGIRVR